MIAVPLRVPYQALRGYCNLAKSGTMPVIKVLRGKVKEGNIMITMFRRAGATIASNRMPRISAGEEIPRIGKYNPLKLSGKKIW